MKRRLIISTGLLFTSVVAFFLFFRGGTINNSTVINDLYVFKGSNSANLVFIGNTQGVLTPAQTATAQFDPNTLIQFNIDNNGDGVEDLVIQAIYKPDGYMYFYGPVAPTLTGTRSQLQDSILQVRVPVTGYGMNATTASNNGVIVFAGPRDNPFYFDLNQYNQILAGSATAFNATGTDYYAGTNVMSVVVEVPKSMLNIPASGKLNVWLTTKRRI